MAKVAERRVAESFVDHDMLNDSDLSEDYDHDPYYQDFCEDYRRINNAQQQQVQDASNQGQLANGVQEDEEKKADEDYGLKLLHTGTPQEAQPSEKPAELLLQGVGGVDNGDIDGDDGDLDTLAKQQEVAQRLLDLGMQLSATFQVELNFIKQEAEGTASLADYIEWESNWREQHKLRIDIDNHYEGLKQLGNREGYNDYFNFGLNTTTWRMFVNKQVLMRYERLFIERQVNDVNTERRRLESELSRLEGLIAEVKRKQEQVKNKGSYHDSHQQSSSSSYYSQGRGHQSRQRPSRHYGGGYNNLPQPGGMPPFQQMVVPPQLLLQEMPPQPLQFVMPQAAMMPGVQAYFPVAGAPGFEQ